MKKGYIKLSRKFFENKIWQAARAFNECEAWLDLIQSARFEASEITSRIGVHEITWGRGQYPASNRFLAKKWGRSEQWVKTFLAKLKKEKMITTDSSKGINVITLLNYETYNSVENADNPVNNPVNNSHNHLYDSQLRDLVTQLITQQLTQLQPTSNPNNKKDKEREEIENNTTPYNPPPGNCEFEKEFEKFRKLYPSTKRGIKTEFENLKKKHKDWKTVIPLLVPAIKQEISFHESKLANGEFVPQYKNLSTWINNRCWEQEFGKELKNDTRTIDW